MAALLADLALLGEPAWSTKLAGGTGTGDGASRATPSGGGLGGLRADGVGRLLRLPGSNCGSVGGRFVLSASGAVRFCPVDFGVVPPAQWCPSADLLIRR